MATANLTDMSILATDTTFGNRVLMSLTQYCTVTVAGSESITTSTVQIHIARKAYASGVLNNPTFYKPLFINAAAANQTVANDATATGTLVGLTSAQVATAAAACTDTDINNAVAAAFNAFIQNI
jgi:hypothetical protein